MRPALTLLLLLPLACGRPPVSLDDESVDEGSSSEESSSEESSSEESTDTDPISSDEELSFITEVDVPLASNCDPFEQNCPPGEKCVPYASGGGVWDAHKCVPVLGDRHPGEPCMWNGIVEATDDCDATSLCWDVMDFDGELIGVCYAMCLGSPDEPQCPPGSSCIIASESTVNVCISDCDPLQQDCGAGLGCYWANGFSCIFVDGNIPTGEPCGFVNDCAPGNFCADAAALPECASSACCTNFCDLGLGDSQCVDSPGTTCVSFFEMGMAPPGHEDVGVCAVP